MGKKIILIVILIGLAVSGFFILNPFKKESAPQSPLTTQNSTKEISPSKTLTDYTDPSGFSLSYPDNLSIVKNETDDNTYTDIQLNSKDVSGSLNLKISDSKFSTLDKWLKLNQEAAEDSPKEIKLGSLKGLEIKTADRLLLGALDKGIFFSIEMPLIETNFWMKVYDSVLTSFSFTSPDTSSSGADTSQDVTFEGEEVVE